MMGKTALTVPVLVRAVSGVVDVNFCLRIHVTISRILMGTAFGMKTTHQDSITALEQLAV